MSSPHPTNLTKATHDLSQSANLLRQGITQSGIDLFAAYGITFTALAEGEAPLAAEAKVTYLALVGFGGAHVSGFAILGLSESLLRRSNLTSSSLGDWTAELANQFLGRIKNRMLRAGIPILRIPPAVITGSPASLFLAQPGTAPVALSNGNDSVLIWMQSEPGTEMKDSVDDPEPGVMDEGEMVLF